MILGNLRGSGGDGGEVYAERGAEEGLVLEILADAGEGVDNRDGVGAEGGGRADTRDHEHLGGLERAC